MTNSLLDIYFQVSKSQINKMLSACLAKGAEFADVFFEYRIISNLSFEEDIVKSAKRGIVQGVGIRAVKGDQIGFAFSEDLTTEKMLEAAHIAATIAADNTAQTRVQPIGQITPKNLYPVTEPATSAELLKKLELIKAANAAAKSFDSKIVRVSVNFNDEIRHLVYADSDGISWEDSQPMFVFYVACVAEHGLRRETGLASSGGRFGLEYFTNKRSAAEIARDSARLAVLNLSAI